MTEHIAQHIPQPSRINFFPGRLLSVGDLEHEQQQARERQWMHNRLLHGHGVVAGLDVTVAGDRVQVSPGFALDSFGREIVLASMTCLDASEVDHESHGRVQVVITWAEEPAGTVLGPAGSVPDSYVNQPLLMLADHVLGELPDHGVLLARLHRRDGQLVADPSVRRHVHR
ncbi:hypothetical protein GCM10009740_37830 [Terrabacter terrae]|uniref:Uncharacterized protein n=1 Tax=Terrabacter terrae TaxID=318434 RepID=A0ABN1ZMM7_9MICO